MSTYLLAWNPRRWNWKNLATQALQTARGETVAGGWTCVNGNVKKGDRLFLVRLGEEPRGIMASGWAQGGVEPGPHYDPALCAQGKESDYVDYEFECLLDPHIDAPLPLNELTSRALSKVHWSPQGSGVRIPEDAAAELELLWEAWSAKSKSYSETSLDASALEGGLTIKMVRHRRREGALRAAKIAKFKREHGNRLFCEVPGCGFDFEAGYGELGRDYAQVHHLLPLSDRCAPRLTKLSDLAVVCANCHAMIHRGDECRSLKGLVQKAI